MNASATPSISITSKGEKYLKEHKSWVFADEITHRDDAISTGDIISVISHTGKWLAYAFYSEKSKLALRIISRNKQDVIDESFWRRRISWAWAHRITCMGSRQLAGEKDGADLECCRVLFAEADGLPGLIVDRYHNIVVVQITVAGMERLRATIYPILLDVLRESGAAVEYLYERADSPTRTKEGLPLYKGFWEGTPVDESATHVIARENGLNFALDVQESQKTGFFCDQKYNRRAIRELAAGKRVLDCFCHVGPFTLNAAAGGAAHVLGVDISPLAIEFAETNARLNNLDETCSFTCQNVMEYLPELAANKQTLRDAGGPFDLIILDPPAFTKSRKTLAHARTAYRELNRAALKLLPRGGYLATCSCSHFMTRDLLSEAIAAAARDVNVELKQVAELQQAPDHPIIWGRDETHYLDFFIFQVV